MKIDVEKILDPGQPIENNIEIEDQDREIEEEKEVVLDQENIEMTEREVIDMKIEDLEKEHYPLNLEKYTRVQSKKLKTLDSLCLLRTLQQVTKKRV